MKAARFRAVGQAFKSNFMRRRPDWNRLGPPLPAWFVRGLARVDRRLVLQYVPPSTVDPAGVPAGAFPDGVWYVCGLLRHSKTWITKRVVFRLTDDQMKPCKPTRTILKLLRHARRLRHRGHTDALERMFEAKSRQLANEQVEESREKLMESIVDTMRRLNMTTRQTRVFLPATA